MMRINLLDWREERRAQRKQQFLAALGMASLLSALIVVGGMFYMDDRIEYQQERNQYLKDELALMEKRIKEIQELEKVKESLLARMRVIEELQQNRSAMVHFFDEIVNTVPEGVHIGALRQQGPNITIDGVADSNGSVSKYMKNLDASPWFDDPRLIVIRTSSSGRQKQASFSLQVKHLNKPSESGAAPAPEEIVQ